MSSVAALPFSTWSAGAQGRGRRLRRSSAASALACAALYLSGVLFLLLNKADPRQAQFASIVALLGALRRRSAAAQEAARLDRRRPASACWSSCPAPWSPRRGSAGRCTATRGLRTPAEVARAGLLDDGHAAARPRILIGRYRGRFLALPGQLSVMLSAPTRSGKGVGVVIPNLLNWPDSVVVLDIKGENYDITAGYRARHGQAVYAFSPFDEEARSHRWNPLTAVRTSPLHRVGDLLAIGQVFFPNDGGSTSSEAFFNDQARNLFLGIGLYLLETPDLPRTIGEMLRQSSGKGQTAEGPLQRPRSRSGSEEGKPLSDECTDALQRLLVQLGEHALQHRLDLQCAADDLRRRDRRCRHQRRRLPARRRAAPAHVDLRAHPAEPAGQRPAAAEPVLLAAGQPEHPAAAGRRTRRLKLQCLLVHDEFAAMGRVGVISVGRGLPRRLQPAPPDRRPGDVAARRGLRREGGPHLRHQPRPADPVRPARAARRRGVQRHARPLHRARHLARPQPLLQQPRPHAPSAATRATSAAPCCCRRSSRRSAPSASSPSSRTASRSSARRSATTATRSSWRGCSRLRRCRRWTWTLHLARVQQRWRYLPDEIAAGETLDVEKLAHDFTACPISRKTPTPVEQERLINGFFDMHPRRGASSRPAGRGDPRRDDQMTSPRVSAPRAVQASAQTTVLGARAPGQRHRSHLCSQLSERADRLRRRLGQSGRSLDDTEVHHRGHVTRGVGHGGVRADRSVRRQLLGGQLHRLLGLGSGHRVGVTEQPVLGQRHEGVGQLGCPGRVRAHPAAEPLRARGELLPSGRTGPAAAWAGSACSAAGPSCLPG